MPPKVLGPLEEQKSATNDDSNIKSSSSGDDDIVWQCYKRLQVKGLLSVAIPVAISVKRARGDALHKCVGWD
eukprot:5225847-Amphidinium_carterae.1